METMLDDKIFEDKLFETIFENKAEQNAVLSKVEKNQNDLEKLQEIAKSRSNEIVSKIKDFNQKIETTKREMDKAKRLAKEEKSFTNKLKRAASYIPFVEAGVSKEDVDRAKDKVLEHTIESLGEVAELVQESIMFSCCNMAFSQCMLNEFYKRFEEEAKNLTADYADANEKTTRAITSIIEGIKDFHKRQKQFEMIENDIIKKYNKQQKAINILFEEKENLEKILQENQNDIKTQQIGINTLSEKTNNLENLLQQTRQNQDEQKTNIQNIESSIKTQDETIKSLQSKCATLEENATKIAKMQKISLAVACVALALSIIGVIVF